ncbi:MAG: DUF485 domain-containing protein [Acidobacteriaceae bacterium]
MSAVTSSQTTKPTDKSQWDRVAEMDEFRLLLLAKVGFVVPATIFFIAYYFALPILVGYFPNLMDRKVWGPVNIAYFFALSQFFVSWTIAFLYVRAAKRFDEYGARIMQRLEEEGKVKVAGQ